MEGAAGGAGGAGAANATRQRQPQEPWQRVHHHLIRLACQQAASDYEQGRWLLEGLRLSVHEPLGFGTYLEYGDRLFGYGQRMVAERLRVAKALEQLPALSEALQTGQLSWSAIREVTRVATAETEGEWLNAAQGNTVRQVEQLVSGRSQGDRPSDAPQERVRRHRLRLEVSGETLATWRQAVGELTRQRGSSLNDDELLLAMARLVLGGPGDDGRASHQIALTVCERCGQGWQQGRGQLVAVGPEVVEMAQCDAQHIGPVDGGGPEAVDADRVDNSGDAQDANEGDGAGDHVGCRCKSKSRRRASQSIPPAVRRAALRRHGGRCAAPGCQCADFLELHHLRYRTDGPCRPEDVIPLCSVHHRRVHAGHLLIEGDPNSALSFYHADVRPYGQAVRPERRAPTWASNDLFKTAQSALRHLGFRQSDVNTALQQLEPTWPTADTHGGKDRGLQQVLRQALAVLTP